MGLNNLVMGKRNTVTTILNKTAIAAFCVFVSIAFGITDQERRTLEKQKQDGVVVDDFNYSDTKGPDKFKTTQPEFFNYNHGIGFGLNDYLIGGTHFFYDYNIHNGALIQLHTKYIMAAQYRGTPDENFYMRNSIQAFSFSVRKLFSQGIYIGLGAEMGQATFEYRDTASKDEYSTKSIYRDIVFEVGWQAWEPFYVVVGASAPFTVTKLPDHDFGEIPDDKGQRDKAEDLWGNARKRMTFIIELGWYIDRKTK